MTRDEQLVINKQCDAYLYLMQAEMEKYFEKKERLNTCQAWIYRTESFLVLKSYNTIVAFIDMRTAKGYNVLRKVYGYTSTSNQHIWKFFKKYGVHPSDTYTYYPLY